MDTTWTAEDARLLRELRDASGVDAAAFARRCALSIGQLAELEKGGSGHFYSESIKAHTGRRLLAKLGHVAPGPAPAPAPPPATVATPAAPLPPVHTPIAKPVPAQPDTMAAVPVSSPPAKPTAPAPAEQTSSNRASDSPTTESRSGAASGSGRTWAGTLVVACAVIGLLAWVNRPKPATAPATAMAAGETVPMVTAAPTAESSEPPQSAAPITAASSSAATPAVAVSPLAAAETRCPAASGPVVKFTPTQALKPSNYVYIESSRPVQVCVTDARQQTITVQLKPDIGESVPGTPPFIVQSTGWADLRIFFQGVRVPLEGMGALGVLELKTP